MKDSLSSPCGLNLSGRNHQHFNRDQKDFFFRGGSFQYSSSFSSSSDTGKVVCVRWMVEMSPAECCLRDSMTRRMRTTENRKWSARAISGCVSINCMLCGAQASDAAA